MKLITIKVVLENLPDESEVEINLIDEYEAEILISTPENSRVSIGRFDYAPLKKEG